jgi:hypothetical protein
MEEMFRDMDVAERQVSPRAARSGRLGAPPASVAPLPAGIRAPAGMTERAGAARQAAFFYERPGIGRSEQSAPTPLSELRVLLDAGAIGPSTGIKLVDEGDWVTLADAIPTIKELDPAAGRHTLATVAAERRAQRTQARAVAASQSEDATPPEAQREPIGVATDRARVLTGMGGFSLPQVALDDSAHAASSKPRTLTGMDGNSTVSAELAEYSRAQPEPEPEPEPERQLQPQSQPQSQSEPQSQPQPQPEFKREPKGFPDLTVDGVRQAATHYKADAAVRAEAELRAAEEERAAAEEAYEQQMVESMRSADQSHDLDAVLALAAQLEDAHVLQAHEHKEHDQLKLKREECAAAFALFDTDGDGSIGVDELQMLAAQLGLPVEDGMLQEVMAGIDEDGSGEITLDEFTEWWLKAQLTNTKAGDTLVILKEHARSMLHKERIYSGEKQHITMKQIEAMLHRASVAVETADFDAAIETYHALLTFRPTDVQFSELLKEAEMAQAKAQYEQAKKEAAEARHMENVARIEKAFCNFKVDREDRKIVQKTMDEAVRISHSTFLMRLDMPRRTKTDLHRRLYRLVRDMEPLEQGSDQSIAAAEAAVSLHEMNVGAVTSTEAPPETVLMCLEALMNAFEPVAPVDRAAEFLALAAKQEIAGAYLEAEQSYASALVALRDSGDRSQVDEAVAGEERVRSLAAVEEFPDAASGLRMATQRAITHGVFITAKSNSAWAREVGILDRARAVAVSLHHAHTEVEVEHAFAGLGRATIHHLSKVTNEILEIDPDGAKIWHSDLEQVLDLVTCLEGLVRILEHCTKAEEMEHTLGSVPINKLGVQLTQNLVTAASQIPDPTREYMNVFEKTCIHVGGLGKFTTPSNLAKIFEPYGRVLGANVRTRDGQNNSWGLVSFATQEEASAVIADQTTPALQPYKRAAITKQQAMRSAGSFAEVCKKQRHVVQELLQREHIAAMPCLEIDSRSDGLAAGPGGHKVAFRVTKYVRRSDVHDLVCQMLGDGFSEPDLDKAMKEMGAVPAPKASAARNWKAALNQEQVDWGDDMVTLDAFQAWWSSPSSPQHIREAAAARAREEEAKAEAEAAARDDEHSIHRSHYNVFELSWNAAHAELARRSEVHDEEREELAKHKSSASALWAAWLATPGTERGRMVDEVVQALEKLEGLIAHDGVDDAVLAEARDLMALIDGHTKAVGRCDMEQFKKLQKRVLAAVRYPSVSLMVHRYQQRLLFFTAFPLRARIFSQ